MAKKRATQKISKKKTAAPAKPGAEAALFQRILGKLSQLDREVAAGNMMSSPGIVRKKKVFAFFWNNEMVFRLGKGFEPDFKEWRYLNPFKDKPPMKGWFVVPPSQKNRWERLAKAAHAVMQAEQGDA